MVCEETIIALGNDMVYENDTHVAILAFDDFLKIVKKRREEEQRKKAEFIKSVPLFSRMNKIVALQLSHCFKE